MSTLDDLRKAYENEKGKDRHTPKDARKAGIIFIIFGVVFVGVNYYTWTQQDSLYSLFLAVAIGFLFLGVFMTIKGRLPKFKR